MKKMTFGYALKTSMFLGLALSLSCKLVAMKPEVEYAGEKNTVENGNDIEFIVRFIGDLISHSKQLGNLCIQASQEELGLYPQNSTNSNHVQAIIEAGILNFSTLLLSLKDNRLSSIVQKEIREKLIAVKTMYFHRVLLKIEDALESIENLNRELTITLCDLKESYFKQIKQPSFIDQWEWELSQQT